MGILVIASRVSVIARAYWCPWLVLSSLKRWATMGRPHQHVLGYEWTVDWSLIVRPVGYRPQATGHRPKVHLQVCLQVPGPTSLPYEVKPTRSNQDHRTLWSCTIGLPGTGTYVLHSGTYSRNQLSYICDTSRSQRYHTCTQVLAGVLHTCEYSGLWLSA